MTTRRRASRPAHRHSSGRDVKDRLVQTRVPEKLESVLKEEARRRRLSVSHLIRNVLEDTLQLVDTVVTASEEIVEGSVRFAGQVARDAGQIAANAREAARGQAGAGAEPTAEPTGVPEPPPARDLSHVLAWNAVVLNRKASCAQCGVVLTKGSHAHLGLSQDPTKPPEWLCQACLQAL